MFFCFLGSPDSSTLTFQGDVTKDLHTTFIAAAMQPEYLQAYTCSQCEDIVLPGKPLDGHVSYIGKWWEPIEAMSFVNPCHVDGICHLGLSVADLQRKANAGCSFAGALWYRMREKLDRELDLDRLLFCTRRNGSFEVLLRLSERPSPRDGAASYVSTDPADIFGILSNAITGNQAPEPSEYDRCYLALLSDRNFMQGHGFDFHLTAKYCGLLFCSISRTVMC